MIGDARAEAHIQDDAGNVWLITPAGLVLVHEGGLEGALLGDLEPRYTFEQEIALLGDGGCYVCEMDKNGNLTNCRPCGSSDAQQQFSRAQLASRRRHGRMAGLGADDSDGGPWVSASAPFIVAEAMGLETRGAFDGLGLETRNYFDGLGSSAESVIDSLSTGAGKVINSYGSTQKDAYQGVLGLGVVGLAGTVLGSMILYRLLFGGR